MPIKDATDYGALDSYIAGRIRNLERAVVHQFMYAAEAAVTACRRRHTYKDRTGNLTSSIGAVVSVDGRIVGKTDFNQVLAGAEGPSKGLDLARSVAEGFPDKIALVLVAGMEYAVYVMNRGYAVIEPGILELGRILPILMNQLSH